MKTFIVLTPEERAENKRQEEEEARRNGYRKYGW